MKNFHIRECASNDIDAIFLLEAEWEREGVSYQFIPVSRAEFTAGFERFQMYHLVAEGDGVIIGYVNGSIRQGDKLPIIPEEEPYLEVENIYVKSEFRNKEIGGSLLKRLLEVARENGIQRFFVSTVTRDIDKILNFYRGHSFKPWYVEMFI
jgi:GNAT superfamily N-acetyltransferase